MNLYQENKEINLYQEKLLIEIADLWEKTECLEIKTRYFSQKSIFSIMIQQVLRWIETNNELLLLPPNKLLDNDNLLSCIHTKITTFNNLLFLLPTVKNESDLCNDVLLPMIEEALKGNRVNTLLVPKKQLITLEASHYRALMLSSKVFDLLILKPENYKKEERQSLVRNCMEQFLMLRDLCWNFLTQDQRHLVDKTFCYCLCSFREDKEEQGQQQQHQQHQKEQQQQQQQQKEQQKLQQQKLQQQQQEQQKQQQQEQQKLQQQKLQEQKLQEQKLQEKKLKEQKKFEELQEQFKEQKLLYKLQQEQNEEHDEEHDEEHEEEHEEETKQLYLQDD